LLQRVKGAYAHYSKKRQNATYYPTTISSSA